jgi:hypothetical protein
MMFCKFGSILLVGLLGSLIVAGCAGKNAATAKNSAIWHLKEGAKQPKNILFSVTASDPKYNVKDTKWEKLNPPFGGGNIRANMITEKSGFSFNFQMTYDFYFIYADGTVAYSRYDGERIRPHIGGAIEIVPGPAKKPDDKLIALLNQHGAGLPAAGAVAAAPKSNVIVAIFSIQDHSNAFETKVLDQLTEYLSANLTQLAGYRVIPPSQLRERLTQQKKESYKNCFDQKCQIELGRAISAQKSLATKILKVGDKCAITSMLYDLRSETGEMAASAETPCGANDLMEGMKKIAQQLADK